MRNIAAGLYLLSIFKLFDISQKNFIIPGLWDSAILIKP